MPDLPPRLLNSFIAKADTSTEVLQLVASYHASFDAIHTATALHRTALHMQPGHEQAISENPSYSLLLDLASNKAHTFKAQATANTLLALAKLLQAHPALLLESLQLAVTRNLTSLSPQQLANSLWALATLDHTPDPEVLAKATHQATIILQTPGTVWSHHVHLVPHHTACHVTC